ncbi:unnamed protein product [Brassica oleracea var. botrytis]|nr:unnamed protein product [Brassica napus]
MSLMSSSLVLCHCLSYHTMRFVPSEGKKDNKRRRSWWQRFFFDDDDVNWLGLRDDDIVDEMSDEEKLETWKRRADAHCEVTRLCWSYVKTVPLAAKTLDVRRSQKRLHLFLMMIYGGSCGPRYCCFRVREEWEIREPESICQHMV